ncbi:UNVERIFIED_ORG: integrase [Variovorax guangxiensis]
MAFHRLTDLRVRRAKPGAAEYLIADGGGLYLRVRPHGGRNWQFGYTLAGKRHKASLGDADTVTLALARDEAQRAREAVAAGQHPESTRARVAAVVEAQQAAADAAKGRETVRSTFGRWHRIDLQRHSDGGAYVKRLFDVEVLPRIGDIYMGELAKSDVLRVVDALLARGVERTAKVALSWMRQMCGFAMDRGIIEADPTARIRKSAIGGKDVERDRVLDDKEIKALAAALPDASLPAAATAAVWITLATCCRIGEITAARWEHVDLNAGTWYIPAENSKTREPLTVQLSPFARRQFESLHEINAAMPMGRVSKWVLYPERVQGEEPGPVDPKTITKQIGDRQREGKPLKNRAVGVERALMLPGGRWTPHDLRRTGATIMVRLGVLPAVADRCLNHKEQNSIRRIYLRHQYVPEMLAAWQLLGDHIEQLLRAKRERP